MKLKEMAYTKAEQKERNSPKEVCAPGSGNKYEGPKYPYGLEIRLENEALKKLGLTTLPKVGKNVRLRAICCVSAVSVSERESGEDNRCLTLQIEQLALGGDPETMEEALEDGIEEAS